MRKKACLAAMLLLLGPGALAQSYVLTVHLSGEDPVTIALDEIRRIEFTGLSMAVEEPAVPTTALHSFLLLQNRPNPTRSSTTIEYETPAEADVSVRIFDMQGALVKELLHETQDGGRHRVTWNGAASTGLPVISGMYFYVVECAGQTLTKRLLLVK
jgi:hypothetical protein